MTSQTNDVHANHQTPSVPVAGEGHPDGGENGSTSEYAQADELSSDVEPDSDQCIESSSQAGSLSQISEPAEHKADESATPLAKVKLSNKLRMTNLVIEEGLGLCRVYNLVKENKDTANSLYKCMKCTNLSRTSAVKFSVHVSCFDGEVEETRGEHHSLCFPVPVAQIKAQEVDREQRTKLRKGFKTPRQAYEEGQAKAEALGADVLHYYPSWQRVRSSYYALAKKRNMK